MTKKSTIYINGQYLKVHDKTLEAFTPGVFKASGVFETMLAIGGQVLDLKAHLKRLSLGVKGAKVSPEVIKQIVKRNGFNISRVRIVAWTEEGKKHLAVMALKYSFPQEKKWKACLIKTSRLANAKQANIKSLDYALFADAYALARLKGFDEALLINKSGFIFEASRANVFWFKNNTLYTPPLSSGCLNGITRAKIIKYAKALKIPFQEKNLYPKELSQAQSVFLTNSLIGLQPITIK